MTWLLAGLLIVSLIAGGGAVAQREKTEVHPVALDARTVAGVDRAAVVRLIDQDLRPRGEVVVQPHA